MLKKTIGWFGLSLVGGLVFFLGMKFMPWGSLGYMSGSVAMLVMAVAFLAIPVGMTVGGEEFKTWRVTRREAREFLDKTVYSYDHWEAVFRPEMRKRIQEAANAALKTLAERFHLACHKQEALRTQSKIAKGDYVFEVYRELEEVDRHVEQLKRKFWRLHELAKRFKFQVLPEVGAYRRIE